MTSAPTPYDPTRFPPGLVGIPAMSWLWTASAEAFISLRLNLPPGSKLAIRYGTGSAAANRNWLVERFLESPQFKWLLFVDADMTPPALTALHLLDRGVDVVSAICYQRMEPFRGAWMDMDGAAPIPRDSTGIHEVACVGAACLLVRRPVLEAIPCPWFEHPVPGLGEDVLFCKKAIQAGWKIFVDAGICAGHMQAIPVGQDEAESFQRSPRGQAMLKEAFEPSQVERLFAERMEAGVATYRC